jgi:hypothetical protein
MSAPEGFDTGGPILLPDSGARHQFGGGAQREADPDKASVEGISPFAIFRLGRLFTRGGAKYGDFRNWERGMPFTRYVSAIVRHAFQYLARDASEDHLAAVMWNAQCLIHHEEVGDSETWDDRPTFARTDPQNTSFMGSPETHQDPSPRDHMGGAGHGHGETQETPSAIPVEGMDHVALLEALRRILTRRGFYEMGPDFPTSCRQRDRRARIADRLIDALGSLADDPILGNAMHNAQTAIEIAREDIG